MGDEDHAAFVERRASCLADLEIPLLASFPYLLGGAERVLSGQWSGRVGRGRSLRGVRFAFRRRFGPVTTVSHDRFPVDLSAIIVAGNVRRSTAASRGRRRVRASACRVSSSPVGIWRRRVIRSEDTARWGV